MRGLLDRLELRLGDDGLDHGAAGGGGGGVAQLHLKGDVEEDGVGEGLEEGLDRLKLDHLADLGGELVVAHLGVELEIKGLADLDEHLLGEVVLEHGLDAVLDRLEKALLVDERTLGVVAGGLVINVHAGDGLCPLLGAHGLDEDLARDAADLLLDDLARVVVGQLGLVALLGLLGGLDHGGQVLVGLGQLGERAGGNGSEDVFGGGHVACRRRRGEGGGVRWWWCKNGSGQQRRARTFLSRAAQNWREMKLAGTYFCRHR